MLRVTFELGKETGYVCPRRIDVHRKRSRLAVIDATGEVLANRNVPDRADRVLR
jgi:hypothetical protein